MTGHPTFPTCWRCDVFFLFFSKTIDLTFPFPWEAEDQADLECKNKPAQFGH